VHYYQHNIGDYARDTGHLSVIEHGIYRLLLDWCYLNEKPITTEQAMRIARGYQVETQSVLSEFFNLESDGWTHKRVIKEIDDYRVKAEKNRQNGAKGGRPKPNNNPVGSQSDAKHNPNQEPITNNQEPITKEIKPRASRKAQPDGCLTVSDLVAQGVDEQHASDWFKARKSKGAKSLTKTAWDAVKAEALNAGVTPAEAVKIAAENTWQGFKAAWLNQNGRGSRLTQSGEDSTREAMRILGFLDDEVIDA